MKKISLLLVVLFAFAVVTCTSGVASALYPKYLGYTIVDLKRSKHSSENFLLHSEAYVNKLVTTLVEVF